MQVSGKMVQSLMIIVSMILSLLLVTMLILTRQVLEFQADSNIAKMCPQILTGSNKHIQAIPMLDHLTAMQTKRRWKTICGNNFIF